MATASTTTPKTLQPRPVRLWARALAWVLVITGMLALGWEIYHLLSSGVWPGIYPVIQLAAAIWLLPLFAFVALKGRTPRNWPGLGAANWIGIAALFAAIWSRR